MKPVLFAVAATAMTLGSFQSAPTGSNAVTFTSTIKPMIDEKCLSCHVKGGSAPFPLQTYAQVKKRADLCNRMMLTRSMPPCGAFSDAGEFCLGGGPLTDDEAVLLQKWIQAGAPEGEASQPKAAPEPGSWALGKPDAVVKPVSPGELPEEGRPYWKAFVVPLGPHAGKRLRAFDVKVAQPEAVRGVTIAVARDWLLKAPKGAAGYTTGGSLDVDAKKYVGTWASGYPGWVLPKGVSMTLDGTALVVQCMTIPRGRIESADFEIALYFSRSTDDKEPEWFTISDEDFEIPAPGNLVLNPIGKLPRDTRLLAVIPEARFYCTSIRLWSKERLLFATRRWEPYWPGVYRYNDPVAFPEGAELKAEFNYDNDIHMGRNEGRRPQTIGPGYRERDELCRLHLLYVRDKPGQGTAAAPKSKGHRGGGRPSSKPPPASPSNAKG
ncbi:MAG: hypothetical protein JST30_06965 [Armatimonadetes bacterium]|nr:hypothetical protein [Armatimonadota bacterium]